MCTVCGCNFSIEHEGENDINKHKSTPKHKQFFDSTQNQKKLTNWGASRATANLDEKVTKSELLFAGFLAEHNLPIATADHAGKLLHAMFTDSKIANKNKSG